MGRNYSIPSENSTNVGTNAADWMICILLLLFVAVVYGRALSCDFVNIDDPDYVTKNAYVTQGLTWESLVWAFTGTHGANWHPLTSLSHIMDVQLFGLNAAGHHATNVVLHLLNVGLVFFVFRWMTGARWQSAVVAALFGLHPLHVESVAWVSERKDVLSAFFWFATMGAYYWYVQRRDGLRYALVIVCFALGLMSKPMLVTLPFVLLLLDYWPLGRLTLPPAMRDWRLILEKVPLFILAGVSCVVTLKVQQAWEAVGNSSEFPMGVRISNTLVGYVRYLGKIIWPDEMAVFYPHPVDTPVWIILGAGLLLIGLTIGILRYRRSAPWLPVGWFWFLGTLLPVIGLVQVGTQSIADRYTYIPSVGLFIIAAWGFTAVAQYLHLPKLVVGTVASAILIAAALGTWRQLGVWRNSITLYENALLVTKDNPIAHYNLGEALSEMGRIDGALLHYREAVGLKPERIDIRSEMADLYLRMGDTQAALEQYSEVVRLQPTVARAQFQLAEALSLQGQTVEAVRHYQEALRLWPDRTEVLQALAWIYATDPQAEIRDGAEAVRLAKLAQGTGEPDARALDVLAAAHAEAGEFTIAVILAQKSMELYLASGNENSAKTVQNRLELYQLGLSFQR